MSTGRDTSASVSSAAIVRVARLNALRLVFGAGDTIAGGRVRLLFGAWRGFDGEVVAHDPTTDELEVRIDAEQTTPHTEFATRCRGVLPPPTLDARA